MDPDAIAGIQASFKGAGPTRSSSSASWRSTAGASPTTRASWRSRPACGRASGSCARAPSTAIVGSPETVRARLLDFQALGISTFILSGVPLLEEAYRFSESVIPGLDVLSPEQVTAAAGAGGDAGPGELSYRTLVGEGRR